MTDNKRDLLLAFCDFFDPKRLDSKLTEETIDAFLAQHLPPIPTTVATSSQSGEEGQAGPGFYGASPAPVAPHVNVTEVVGHMMSEGGYGEGPSFLVSAENGQPVRE